MSKLLCEMDGHDLNQYIVKLSEKMPFSSSYSAIKSDERNLWLTTREKALKHQIACPYEHCQDVVLPFSRFIEKSIAQKVDIQRPAIMLSIHKELPSDTLYIKLYNAVAKMHNHCLDQFPDEFKHIARK